MGYARDKVSLWKTGFTGCATGHTAGIFTVRWHCTIRKEEFSGLSAPPLTSRTLRSPRRICSEPKIPSAEQFLASDCIGRTGCLVLDIAMPGMSGPDLQQELIRRGHETPIVFITAHGDVTDCPRILERDAKACLFKPFSDTALLEALNSALGAN